MIHRAASAMRTAFGGKPMTRFDARSLVGPVPQAGRTIEKVESHGKHLEIGEWVKTGKRGPNALDVIMAGGGRLLLGPGALVELASSAGVTLHRGEVLAEATREASLRVDGPSGSSVTVTLSSGSLLVRR